MPNHRDSEERAASLVRFFVNIAQRAAVPKSDRERTVDVRRFRRDSPREVVQRSDIYTADVLNLTDRFGRTLMLADVMYQGRVPVVVGKEGPIPIDMSTVLGRGPFDVRQVEFGSERSSLISFPWNEEAPFSRMRIANVPSEEAIGLFQTQLFRFLYTRFEARESDISEKPGRLFTVTTDTEKLRVHYSTAFIFEPDQVFGEPTNPVRGWLQPGNYHFGAVGLGVDLWFDMDAKYEVPRLDHAHLRI